MAAGDLQAVMTAAVTAAAAVAAVTAAAAVAAQAVSAERATEALSAERAAGGVSAGLTAEAASPAAVRLLRSSQPMYLTLLPCAALQHGQRPTGRLLLAPGRSANRRRLLWKPSTTACRCEGCCVGAQGEGGVHMRLGAAMGMWVCGALAVAI